MKAILEFDFDKQDADDRSNFEDAVNGSKWKSSAWDMDQWLRAQYKYMPDDEYSEDAYNAYEKARQKLSKILYEHGLTLD